MHFYVPLTYFFLHIFILFQCNRKAIITAFQTESFLLLLNLTFRVFIVLIIYLFSLFNAGVYHNCVDILEPVQC